MSVRRSGRGRPCRTSLLIGRPAQLLPPPPLPPTSNKPSDTSARVLITLAVHGGIGAQICNSFSQLSKVWCQNARCLGPKLRTTLVRGAGCVHVREHRGESQLRWMAARSPYVLKRPPRPRPTNPTQFGRAGARTTCDSCLWGCTKCRARAFHVLAVWMVAEAYLGQLEAAETNRRRRTRLDNNVESDSSSNLETDSSTSSQGSDEMMQGAATDPLSSPEVVTNRHHCASQHHN